MRVVALHGMPTSPRLFERLQLPAGWELVAPQVPGLGRGGTPRNWSLRSCAAELRPVAEGADILVGHDMGGVLCAMVARPGQTVVLSGTALGMYWTMIRITTLPLLRGFFYDRYVGQRFLREGGLPEHVPSLLEAFGDHGGDWSNRMQTVARRMKAPPGLPVVLRSCGVRLAWGRKDPWYPNYIAHTVRRTTGGRLHWLESGHFGPWEDPRGFADVITGQAFVA